ncbi:DegT/DnrJ/EryC1/StrS family aminotransferase [Corynebacterium alimapuense]|uniref:Aminotransferase n=1 Tax=Corynebacterium alimapuense TaxID=1576874 RepID=A0A3M8K8S3_9CORY|nr:aminotransferase class I/II-fold pyridoxal phosphate-dependent enzyme [Corynebacterium alimapuense]RNE48932.1 aminotransferase [Corynebacterium alimapuense]
MNHTPTKPTFTLDLTKPEPVPQQGIDRALELMNSGRLFRYGETAPGQLSDASLLEQRMAQLLNRKYAIGVNSCGAALFLALKSSGVHQGDKVLVNGYTLAPVPGAIDHAGAEPVVVEVNEQLTIDFDDLRRKAHQSGARTLLLSHMRGHISDMDQIVEQCEELDLTLIEDCAHTLGASWNGKPTGAFGTAACISLQTFKHINSGEGGIIVTDDEDLAARAILYSGSYMLYEQHTARPDATVFEKHRGNTPNYSLRMTALAAALALPQLELLSERAERMNASYRCLEQLLAEINGVQLIQRDTKEEFIGSSLQFRLPGLNAQHIEHFIATCQSQGLGLKWFGKPRMEGFTSRPSHWEYVTDSTGTPRTEELLSTLCDIRIPPAMNQQHCRQAAEVIAEALEEITT